MNTMYYWWIVGVIAVLVVGYVVFVSVSIYRATRETRVLMAEAVAYLQHPQNPTASILIAGDSTGVGTGASTPQDSIAGHIGVVDPHADITNVSVNGLRLAGLVDVLAQQPKDRHYDLIVLQIGANDVVQFTSLRDVRAQLAQVLAFTHAHADHTIILTAGNVGNVPIFRWPLNWIFKYRTYKVRAIFMQEIAAYPEMSYIDLVKDTSMVDFTGNTPRYIAADGFHPSSAGYALWWKYVEPRLPSSILN